MSLGTIFDNLTKLDARNGRALTLGYADGKADGIRYKGYAQC